MNSQLLIVIEGWLNDNEKGERRKNTMANNTEERYINFELNGLNYRFAFDPMTDDPNEGATLTSVSNGEGQSLAPSEFAEDAAWPMANGLLGLPEN